MPGSPESGNLGAVAGSTERNDWVSLQDTVLSHETLLRRSSLGQEYGQSDGCLNHPTRRGSSKPCLRKFEKRGG